MSTLYKAQWPMSTTEEIPMVLIYPAKRRQPWTYMPATAELREQLFAGKYIRVYFFGRITGDTLQVDKFVRRGEWV